ncbi:MAG: AraC-like transcriptional regulator QhpR [Steroidobacteraceae bacterium]
MCKARTDASRLGDWQAVVERVGHPPLRQGLEARITALLAESGSSVPLDDYVALLEDFSKAAEPSATAWLVGSSSELPFGGALDGIALSSPSLGTALHWMCQYFPLLQDSTLLKLEVGEERATLHYRILDPSIWPRHEDALYTLGLLSSLLRCAAPGSWKHVQVGLEVEQEHASADLEAVLKARVEYGSPTNWLRFPAALLDAPLNPVHATNGDVLKQLAWRLSRRNQQLPLSDRARQMIYREMSEGRVSQEHIAKELGVSGRTLRRKLAEEGLSFQELLDDCRMRFATLEFRTRRGVSLSEMALRLGYSEHSTFSRAFARWAGMAPQQYRRHVAAAA